MSPRWPVGSVSHESSSTNTLAAGPKDSGCPTGPRLRVGTPSCAESRELPGSILAVQSAFADVSVVGQVSNLPELPGDNNATPHYNAFMEAAAGQRLDDVFQQSVPTVSFALLVLGIASVHALTKSDFCNESVCSSAATCGRSRKRAKRCISLGENRCR